MKVTFFKHKPPLMLAIIKFDHTCIQTFVADSHNYPSHLMHTKVEVLFTIIIKSCCCFCVRWCIKEKLSPD